MHVTTIFADIPPDTASAGSSWPIVIGAVAAVAVLLIAIGVLRRRSSGRSSAPDTDR